MRTTARWLALLLALVLLAAACDDGGSSSAQMSCAFQQRVRNRQPDGGFTGLGTSPLSTIRSRLRSRLGSGSGTADSNAWV